MSNENTCVNYKPGEPCIYPNTLGYCCSNKPCTDVKNSWNVVETK
jgi:hypothetical protein